MKPQRLPDGVIRIERAAELPAAWDALSSSVFQTRALLAHAEAANPCRQRYYVFAPAGEPTALAVVYTIRLDLFTYRGLKSPIRVDVIGLPCSVAWPGILGECADFRYLLAGVRAREPGLLLGLNTLAPVPVSGLPQGSTLPTLVLERGFSSFGAYRGALRTDYRRRLDRTRKAFAGLREERLGCSAFDTSMYRFYLEAFERSDAKLEKLPLAFLAGLPAPFRLTVFRQGERLVGWQIAAFEPGRVTFFMGGVDQALRDTHHTYHNLLFSVLEQAFEAGATQVDLGQTAEVAKTRTGALPAHRGMFAWPRSTLLRGAMRLGRGFLEYKASFPSVHVFRDGS